MSPALRRFVLEPAKNRCEYCQIAGWPLTVDHWRDAYRTVIGRTPVGRVTAKQLDVNREIYRQQRMLLRAAMRGGAPRWP
jgi:hypothetical protein